ncbi:MAG: ORF6N domain-containing protein [Clostridiales bacterium]|nr:ORF6N domain-containing protein [Clostridiales bacterium]
MRTMSEEIIVYEPLDKEKVRRQIFEFRGIRVMFDSDIAVCFGVETGTLNRAMKRNIKRFPETFCFQLTDDELSRCQSGISMQTIGKRGGRTYKPYVYSEQGVAMLTSVLRTIFHTRRKI